MLCNSMFLHGFLPPSLMKTVIVPVIKDKKGIVTDKDNYRPIAVTSVVSKLIELLLLDHMQDHLGTAGNQFGFKQGHGTDMCVFALKETIDYYRQKSSPVYVCFLDASKAFDRINHWCLFSKLIKRGVHRVFVRLLVFWYCSQEFCVRWGNTYSQFFSVVNGVRQGGIISPILFNIYMNDLSVTLNKSNVGCKINGQVINHLMYADDTCLIGSSPSSLQRLLDITSDFASSNLVTFNEKKTKCICFLPRRLQDLCLPTVFLHERALAYVDSIKYLGVILNKSTRDDEDIMRQVRAIYSRGNVLISRLRHCSVDVKISIFRSFMSTAYCCQLWSNSRCLSLHKLTVAYNNIFRKFVGIRRGVSMSATYVAYGIDPMCVIIRKSTFSFQSRIKESSNCIIESIRNSLFHNTVSAINARWRHVLHL